MATYTGLQFFVARCRSIFIHILLVSSEKSKFFETECIMTIQSHPTSLVLASVESANRTSYWSSIVTLVPSCGISEILELLYAKCHLSRTPPLFGRKFRTDPSRKDPWRWVCTPQRANIPG